MIANRGFQCPPLSSDLQ
ncbi:unnamed protein product, partial [Rotaria sp. Silwood1]